MSDPSVCFHDLISIIDFRTLCHKYALKDDKRLRDFCDELTSSVIYTFHKLSKRRPVLSPEEYEMKLTLRHIEREVGRLRNDFRHLPYAYFYAEEHFATGLPVVFAVVDYAPTLVVKMNRAYFSHRYVVHGLKKAAFLGNDALQKEQRTLPPRLAEAENYLRVRCKRAARDISVYEVCSIWLQNIREYVEEAIERDRIVASSIPDHPSHRSSAKSEEDIRTLLVCSGNRRNARPRPRSTQLTYTNSTAPDKSSSHRTPIQRPKTPPSPYCLPSNPQTPIQISSKPSPPRARSPPTTVQCLPLATESKKNEQSQLPSAEHAVDDEHIANLLETVKPVESSQDAPSAAPRNHPSPLTLLPTKEDDIENRPEENKQAPVPPPSPRSPPKKLRLPCSNDNTPTVPPPVANEPLPKDKEQVEPTVTPPPPFQEKKRVSDSDGDAKMPDEESCGSSDSDESSTSDDSEDEKPDNLARAATPPPPLPAQPKLKFVISRESAPAPRELDDDKPENRPSSPITNRPRARVSPPSSRRATFETPPAHEHEGKRSPSRVSNGTQRAPPSPISIDDDGEDGASSGEEHPAASFSMFRQSQESREEREKLTVQRPKRVMVSGLMRRKSRELTQEREQPSLPPKRVILSGRMSKLKPVDSDSDSEYDDREPSPKRAATSHAPPVFDGNDDNIDDVQMASPITPSFEEQRAAPQSGDDLSDSDDEVELLEVHTAAGSQILGRRDNREERPRDLPPTTPLATASSHARRRHEYHEGTPAGLPALTPPVVVNSHIECGREHHDELPQDCLSLISRPAASSNVMARQEPQAEDLYPPLPPGFDLDGDIYAPSEPVLDRTGDDEHVSYDPLPPPMAIMGQMTEEVFDDSLREEQQLSKPPREKRRTVWASQNISSVYKIIKNRKKKLQDSGHMMAGKEKGEKFSREPATTAKDTFTPSLFVNSGSGRGTKRPRGMANSKALRGQRRGGRSNFNLNELLEGVKKTAEQCKEDEYAEQVARIRRTQKEKWSLGLVPNDDLERDRKRVRTMEL